MSIVCPPKNEPRWKKLVESLGEEKAYVAFFRNGHDIPEIDVAQAHLKNKPANYEAPDQLLAKEQANTKTFEFGPVNLSLSGDLREIPDEAKAGVDWEKELSTEGAMGSEANASQTRIAMAMRAPDGSIVVAGLLPSSERLRVGRKPAKETAVALQRFAEEKRAYTKKEGKREPSYTKKILEGGNRPALLNDVIAAGYEPIAKLSFDAEPGKIFQKFGSEAEFDAAWNNAQKSEGANVSQRTGTVVGETATVNQLYDQITAKAKLYDSAKGTKEKEAIRSDIQQIYAKVQEMERVGQTKTGDLSQQDQAFRQKLREKFDPANPEGKPTAPSVFLGMQEGLPEAGIQPIELHNLTSDIPGHRAGSTVSRQTLEKTGYYVPKPAGPGSGEVTKPIEPPHVTAGRTKEFLNAIERVRGMGGDVKLLAQELLRQETGNPNATGVTYTPWHIALGMKDVMNATTEDLVGLLHEAGHMQMGRLRPELQTAITNGVQSAFDSFQARLRAAAEKTGIEPAVTRNSEELLVETLSQEFAAKGVPEAPSLAQSIVRWVKDLYLRAAMAIQASFGRQPDPNTAVAWFENQLNRRISGDYHFGMFDFIDRIMPEPIQTERSRYRTVSGSTPGGVAEYLDPVTGKVYEPAALPDTVDAIKYNLKFRTENDEPLGKELDIPNDEAYPRIFGAVSNEFKDLAESVRTEAAPTMTPEQVWTIIGRGDAPDSRLKAIEQAALGASEAKIGGARMTEAMNQRAQAMTMGLLNGAERTNVRRESARRDMAERASQAMVQAAKDINKLEGNLRDSTAYVETFDKRIKEILSDYLRSVRNGFDDAETAGELGQAVREAERLSSGDPIPEEYQRVFKAVMDGQVPIYDYLLAISKLDLPLPDLKVPEIIAKIRENAAGDSRLNQLTQNRPLMAALATLARNSVREMDFLQLKSISDVGKYLDIKSELEAVRKAGRPQLEEMLKTAKTRAQAKTLVDRLKADLLDSRRRLNRSNDMVKISQERAEILRRSIEAIRKKRTEMEKTGLGAFSEVMVHDGMKIHAMRLADDGKWLSSDITINFNPDQTAVNAEQLDHQLVMNNAYLAENQKEHGSRFYQEVERQTRELQMIDSQRKGKNVWLNTLDMMIKPLYQKLKSTGAKGADRAAQMMLKYELLVKKNWQQVEPIARQWSSDFSKALKASGIKSDNDFLEMLFDPVNYLIENSPGKDEGPVLRDAVKLAKQNLSGEPAPEFDGAFRTLLRTTKQISEHFVSIAEAEKLFVKDPRLGEALRKTVAQGWLTNMRRVNGGLMQTIVRDMQNNGWNIEFKDDPKSASGKRIVKATTFDGLTPDIAANDQALAQTIAPKFTPGIIRDFIEPFINKPGVPVFSYDGEAISQLTAQHAWDDAGGNPIKWLDNIWAKVSSDVKPEDLDKAKAEFRVAMIQRFDQLFLMEARIANDANVTRSFMDPWGSKAHRIMDARQNELIPPEHVTYQTYHPLDAYSVLREVAFHAAYGRNASAFDVALREAEDVLLTKKNEFDRIPQGRKRDMMEAAKARGHDYEDLKTAARNYGKFREWKQEFEHIYGPKSNITEDFKVAMQGLHAMTSLVVNSPKTMLRIMSQMLDTPLAMRSLGPTAIKSTLKTLRGSGESMMGSMLNSFGIHIMNASDYMREMGGLQRGMGTQNLPYRVAWADAGRRGKFDESAMAKYLIKPGRQFEAALQKGVGPGGDTRGYQRFNLLTSPAQWGGTAASIGEALGSIGGLEMMVSKGIKYFQENPEVIADPTFRFTVDNLGVKGGLFSDQGAFEHYKDRSLDYGLGRFEDLVRDAMPRAARGERLLTTDQAHKAGMVGLNEIGLHASVNSRASWMINGPLKFFMPLVGWPIQKMNMVRENFRTLEGESQYMAHLRALGTIAAWSVPMGVAFTLLTDKYDEYLLKKKSNIRSVSPLAAIPIAGIPLALALGDKSIGQQAAGIGERAANAGALGLGGEFFAQWFAPYDASSGQRAFSLDQRVFAMSQLLSAQQALENFFGQGEHATYASVGRPLITALGGNGPIQALQILNNLAGLDDAEARVTNRINVNNWLRASGREIGLEVKKASAVTSPTEEGLWLREMQLAAMANDRLAFLDNYKKAVMLERLKGVPNPEQKVLSSWKSRNPLSAVFERKPDDIELARLYAVMNEGGRSVVRESLRLFQDFTALIDTDPYERAMQRQVTAATRVQNPLASRRALAGSLMGY